MRLLIQVHFELGQMQNFAGKTDEARKHIATALHLARPYQAAAPSDEDRWQFLGGTLAGFADLQFDSRQVREALANYREALAVLDSAEFRWVYRQLCKWCAQFMTASGWLLRKPVAIGRARSVSSGSGNS